MEISSSNSDKNLFIPLYVSRVSCGFPSPAEEYLESQLDLNEKLISKPAATFFVRAEGDSMLGAGIFSGDLLIVDRSLTAHNGSIVLAVINGEFTVKRFIINNKNKILQAENPKYKSIAINETMDFQIWGVVTYVIHSCLSK